MSKPRAISSNSSAMPSNYIPEPPYNMPQSADGPLELTGAVGLGVYSGVVPKLSCWWHCGSRRRRSAPYAVLIEPTC
jgi:hypothetical protein